MIAEVDRVAEPHPEGHRRVPLPRWHFWLVLGLLVLTAALALGAAVSDSITFDEPAHLTSGMSHLLTGDFRLQPEHPPLAKSWAALPLLLMNTDWPGPDAPGWAKGDFWSVGRLWLFDRNDGERLMLPARCMIVVLHLATCVSVYLLGRSLFGPNAGLMGLALASLSPNLLAHGHLVTNDTALTLFTTVTLLTFAWLMRAVTWVRFLGAVLSMAALTLVKFSWLLILPAMAAMALVTVIRGGPVLRVGPWAKRLQATDGPSHPPPACGLGLRCATLVIVVCLGALMCWAAIWTCYGWRYSPFSGTDSQTAMMTVIPVPGRPLARNMPEAWAAILTARDGTPMGGPVPAFIRWTGDHQLLPEAYLYGLAETLNLAQARPAYLNGEVYHGGRRAYFPIAFMLKTPLATLGLLLAGIAHLAIRRAAHLGDWALLCGSLVFVGLLSGLAISGNVNIGLRHVLPVYPVLFALAGGAVGWLRYRVGRWLVSGLLVWLLISNLTSFPHYLSYFNEAIRGQDRAHLYIAGSNLDWGQDLKRLAVYVKEHGHERIKLSYHGTADPTRYGFACDLLPCFLPLGSPAPVAAGTYVISVNQLLGLHAALARQESWTSQLGHHYSRLHDLAESPLPAGAAPRARQVRQLAIERYRMMRWGRLMMALRQRPPDDRVGRSLFVYRLTDRDIDRMTDPRSGLPPR